MTEPLRMKYENPRLKQSEITNQLGYSTSTLLRYRNDKKMLSAYEIQPNNIKKQSKKVSNNSFDNNSHRDPDVKNLKWPQIDLKRIS